MPASSPPVRTVSQPMVIANRKMSSHRPAGVPVRRHEPSTADHDPRPRRTQQRPEPPRRARPPGPVRTEPTAWISQPRKTNSSAADWNGTRQRITSAGTTNAAEADPRAVVGRDRVLTREDRVDEEAQAVGQREVAERRARSTTAASASGSGSATDATLQNGRRWTSQAVNITNGVRTPSITSVTARFSVSLGKMSLPCGWTNSPVIRLWTISQPTRTRRGEEEGRRRRGTGCRRSGATTRASPYGPGGGTAYPLGPGRCGARGRRTARVRRRSPRLLLGTTGRRVLPAGSGLAAG